MCWRVWSARGGVGSALGAAALAWNLTPRFGVGTASPVGVIFQGVRQALGVGIGLPSPVMSSTEIAERRPGSWQAALTLVKQRGLEHRREPFRLASGAESFDYIDGKHAVDTGPRLQTVSVAIVELAAAHGIGFNAVGGLTMGADALAVGVAMVSGCAWFSVRKKQKPRGHQQWIEGTRLGRDHRVLLLDDVVSTGGSLLVALERVAATGAVIAGAIPMVDRGESARRVFGERKVPYVALVTYRDLGIAPVGGP